MTKSIAALWDSCRTNKEYIAAIKDADNDPAPKSSDDAYTQHFHVAVYYGWLVGKYGNDWRKYL